MSTPKMKDAMMDAIVVVSEAKGAMSAIINGIDTSILADQSNDKDLLMSLEVLDQIILLVDPNSEIYKHLQKLKHHLSIAAEKDFFGHHQGNLEGPNHAVQKAA